MNGFKRCFVISGGEYSPLPQIRSSDYIIACDKGYEYAKKSGVLPHLVIGDFDSYEGPLPEDIPVMRLPCEKDDTDTMFAIKYAIKHGCREIVLTCALGGRLDHMYGNLQSCVYAVEHGISITIEDQTAKIYFVHNAQLVLPKNPEYSLSVFGVSDICREVFIKGAKYELEHAELKNSSPIGVSNEWRDETVSIGTTNGTMMIVLAKKQGGAL